MLTNVAVDRFPVTERSKPMTATSDFVLSRWYNESRRSEVTVAEILLQK
jgi:hypothetical protein